MRGGDATASGEAASVTSVAPRLHAALPGPLQVLSYDVHSWSSYSTGYHPRNILVDRPLDQGSRWSSATNNPNQYLVVRLEKLSIVGTILFGKHHKNHVCNLREFKVFGGITPDSMVELLHSGLRNDDEAETFPLKTRIGGDFFPCQYIKIVPLLAWAQSFNYSIWFLQLRGIDDSAIVNDALNSYNAYRETEAMRLCLKYFRQHNYLDVFDALQARCQHPLEHPTLTTLHRAVVLEGNFEEAERLTAAACEQGVFDGYIRRCTYTPAWKRLRPEGPAPGRRGGHQMCIDSDAGQVYLFGGWDGTSDLGDFWRYDIEAGQWTLISSNVAEQGGPVARSCHKICIDPSRRLIYTLGGYIELDPVPAGGEDKARHPTSAPENKSQPCDFYVYDIDANRWTAISRDVYAEGGPDLIYDHQMCIDTERQKMFVFGGKVRPSETSSSENTHRGLYVYDIARNHWHLVRSDSFQPEAAVKLKSRIGHCMLLHPREGLLYIFAGQRFKDYLNDYYIYHIETDRVIFMQKELAKVGGPDPGFTQRATIDPDLNEIYVMSGLLRDGVGQDVSRNSFWVQNLADNSWTRIYQNDNSDPQYWAQMEEVEPPPRFAHQLVYDRKTKAHYLFGGTPSSPINKRFDDFWELRLLRPTRAEVLRMVRLILRRQLFIEKCREASPTDALHFLQTSLSEVVDHSNEEESAKFRALSASLFANRDSTATELFAARTAVYEELLVFFDDAVKQPHANLIDLIQPS